MARNCYLSFFLLIVCFFGGCTRMESYFINRAHDAGDIVFITTGLGLGANARIGPLHAGLLANYDWYGWHNQWIGAASGEEWLGRIDFDWTIGAMQQFACETDKREKGYTAIGGLPRSGESWAGGFPFLTSVEYLSTKDNALFDPFYTQIEVCAGLVGSAHAGVNPGELVDFALGFVGIDIFDDDIAGTTETAKTHID
jgi:hypothetical protein